MGGGACWLAQTDEGLDAATNVAPAAIDVSPAADLDLAVGCAAQRLADSCSLSSSLCSTDGACAVIQPEVSTNVSRQPSTAVLLQCAHNEAVLQFLTKYEGALVLVSHIKLVKVQPCPDIMQSISNPSLVSSSN